MEYPMKNNCYVLQCCFTVKSTAEAANVEKPSLVSCLKKPLFILHVVWLSLIQLRFYYFLGTLNKYLNTLFDGDKKQGLSPLIKILGLITNLFYL